MRARYQTYQVNLLFFWCMSKTFSFDIKQIWLALVRMDMQVWWCSCRSDVAHFCLLAGVSLQFSVILVFLAGFFLAYKWFLPIAVIWTALSVIISFLVCYSVSFLCSLSLCHLGVLYTGMRINLYSCYHSTYVFAITICLLVISTRVTYSFHGLMDNSSKSLLLTYYLSQYPSFLFVDSPGQLFVSDFLIVLFHSPRVPLMISS